MTSSSSDSTTVTPYQWLILFVAWLGWVFDSMDATIYALVLHPALEDLLMVSHDAGKAGHLDVGDDGAAGAGWEGDRRHQWW